MISRIWRYKWYLAALLVLILAVPAISSYLTFLLQRIYNEVSPGTSKILIFRLVLQGVLIWLVNRLLFYSQSIVKSKIICNVKQDLKHDIFVSALGVKSSGLFQKAASGEYISIFSNDISIIEQRFFSVFLDLIAQIASISIFSGAFLSMNRKLALFVIVFTIGVMFVPLVFAGQLNRDSLDYSKNASTFTQGVKEFAQSFAAIKGFAAENAILRRLDTQNQDMEEAKFHYDSALALADGVGSLLTWFARMVVIGAGLVMVSRGEILLGTVVAAQTFSVELAAPLQLVVQDINSLKSIRSILDKIEELTFDPGLAEPMDFALDKFSDPPAEVRVEFNHLTIHGENKTILDDFSFTFQPGKKYLVLGKNGAGKSSIFKALKHRFSAYEGSIRLNDRELNTYSNQELSKMVAYLGEHVSLFTGSVAENITLWKELPADLLTQVAKDVKLSLPLDRLIGDEGFNISSGEQRRIEIARGLIEPVKVVIFDEVVSTLDIETAYDIEKTALEYQDKTVIFISHNFSGKLIGLYDDILVIENGRLADHGVYEELLEKSVYFRRICDIKFGFFP